MIASHQSSRNSTKSNGLRIFVSENNMKVVFFRPFGIEFVCESLETLCICNGCYLVLAGQVVLLPVTPLILLCEANLRYML